MNNKPHGNTGNRNALKGDAPKDAFLHIRINGKVKAKAKADAKRHGLSVSEWVELLIKAG